MVSIDETSVEKSDAPPRSHDEKVPLIPVPDREMGNIPSVLGTPEQSKQRQLSELSEHELAAMKVSPIEIQFVQQVNEQQQEDETSESDDVVAERRECNTQCHQGLKGVYSLKYKSFAGRSFVESHDIELPVSPPADDADSDGLIPPNDPDEELGILQPSLDQLTPSTCEIPIKEEDASVLFTNNPNVPRKKWRFKTLFSWRKKKPADADAELAVIKESTETEDEEECVETISLEEAAIPPTEPAHCLIPDLSESIAPAASKSISVRFLGLESIRTRSFARKRSTLAGEEEDTPSVVSSSSKSSSTPPPVDISEFVDVKPEIYEQMAALREKRNKSLYMFRHISDISSLGAQGHMSVYNFSEAVKELPSAVESFSQDVSHITLDFLRESFNVSMDDTDRNEDDDNSVGLNPISFHDGSNDGCYKANFSYFCEALHEECSPIMTCRCD